MPKTTLSTSLGFREYLEIKGGFHDCVVECFEWMPADGRVQIRLADTNANFTGLPDYLGLVPCLLLFGGVDQVKFALDFSERKLKIYDSEMSIDVDVSYLVLSLYPTGNLHIHFRSIELTELA